MGAWLHRFNVALLVSCRVLWAWPLVSLVARSCPTLPDPWTPPWACPSPTQCTLSSPALAVVCSSPSQLGASPGPDVD